MTHAVVMTVFGCVLILAGLVPAGIGAIPDQPMRTSTRLKLIVVGAAIGAIGVALVAAARTS